MEQKKISDQNTEKNSTNKVKILSKKHPNFNLIIIKQKN